MRREVQTFVADGPLPDWDAGEEEIDRRVTQLEAITKPVTGEEAAALVSCAGPDESYGVAWTLLHLIETGPLVLPVASPGRLFTADRGAELRIAGASPAYAARWSCRRLRRLWRVAVRRCGSGGLGCLPGIGSPSTGLVGDER
ncbi:hypothetical protein ACFV0B_22320 [Streptomyces xanthophaeus]|uniref:hypothetical protein n=1 Tax=Streptomyces xanthophaeus TaxID=67385 RepID=UPI0036AC6FA8